MGNNRVPWKLTSDWGDRRFVILVFNTLKFHLWPKFLNAIAVHSMPMTHT